MRPLPRLLRPSLAVLLAVWTALFPAVAAFAAPAPTPASSAAADADFAVVRAADPEVGAQLAALRREVDALVPEKLGPEQKLPRVPADTLLDFNRRYRELIDSAYLINSRKPKVFAPNSKEILAFLSVGQRISLLSLEAVPLDLKEVSSALTEIEARAESLDAEVRARAAKLAPPEREDFMRRLNAINAEGTSAWNHLHTASLIIDDLGDGIEGTPPAKRGDDYTYKLTDGGKLDQSANPLQTRIAKLSARLVGIERVLQGERTTNEETRSKALQARMSKLFATPFGVSAGPDGTGGGSAAAPDLPARPDGVKPLPAAARARTLLDLTPVPAIDSVADKPRPLPAVFTGGKGRDADPEETKKVNALRAAGKTRTIGDPETRAKFVYRQEGETCGIAAQVQVLADSGLVPADPKALKAKEDELYARALVLGYFEGSPADPERRFHGGNPGQYVGNLLDRPMRKSFAASEEDLFKAASSGRIVIATFSSEHLWNDRRFRGGGHTVAITGVEVDRDSGKPLGYYINDTGTNEGGRFVAAGQFLKAWKNRGRTIFEPL